MRPKMLCLLVLPLVIPGCDSPPPQVPPGAMLIEGEVRETRGYCHTVAVGQSVYAVHYGQLPGMKRGDRVRLIGEIAEVQDCPGAKVLRLIYRAERI